MISPPLSLLMLVALGFLVYIPLLLQNRKIETYRLRDLERLDNPDLNHQLKWFYISKMLRHFLIGAVFLCWAIYGFASSYEYSYNIWYLVGLLIGVLFFILGYVLYRKELAKAARRDDSTYDNKI